MQMRTLFITIALAVGLLAGGLHWSRVTLPEVSAPVNAALLARVRDLTKQLLISYVEDAQCCKNMGMKPDQILLQFTHDKIVRLTIAFDELNRQLADPEMPSRAEIQARLERMAEIIQQSLSHAKRDVRRMACHEIAQNAPLLSLLTAQIAAKSLLLSDLQKTL